MPEGNPASPKISELNVLVFQQLFHLLSCLLNSATGSSGSQNYPGLWEGKEGHCNQESPRGDSGN